VVFLAKYTIVGDHSLLCAIPIVYCGLGIDRHDTDPHVQYCILGMDCGPGFPMFLPLWDFSGLKHSSYVSVDSSSSLMPSLGGGLQPL
jgi:hypothetical protein